MSKVFTWEEVAGRKIPRLEDFRVVGRHAREILSSGMSPVTGALIIGSFVHNKHTIKSDIDLVALYPQTRRREAIETLQGLKSFAKEFFVPMEIISLDTDLAGTPRHHLATSFVEHLKIAAREGGVIKRNPVPLIHSNTDGLVEDARTYLIRKMRLLEKGEVALPSASPEDVSDILENILDIPVYAARKILRCSGELFPRGDGKNEVLQVFAKRQGASGLGILDEVQSLNREYLEILERQVLEPDQALYYATLKKIERALPRVLDFARINLFSL